MSFGTHLSDYRQAHNCTLCDGPNASALRIRKVCNGNGNNSNDNCNRTQGLLPLVSPLQFSQFECKPKTLVGCVAMCVAPAATPRPSPPPSLSLSVSLRLFLCVSPSGNGRPAANCRAAQLCISLHIFEPEESEGKVAGGEDRCVWGFWGLHI